jgi:hypothetical protein
MTIKECTLRSFGCFAVALVLGMITGCDKAVQWTEDVKLSDGRTVVANAGGGLRLRSFVFLH